MQFNLTFFLHTKRRRFARVYREFGSGFGVYDPNAKVWREELLRGLMP